MTVWRTMAIDMSNERSQRDLTNKKKFKLGLNQKSFAINVHKNG